MKKIVFISLSFFISLTLFAQSPVESKLMNTFDSTENIYQENIYCHLNKNLFVLGEKLWFQAYTINKSNYLPSLITTNIIVDLINEKGEKVIEKIFYSTNGIAPGQIETAILPSGNYIFRAYSNWMKNFGEDSFFTKQIQIINDKVPIPKSPQELNFSLHPEGGRLLADIEQKVVLTSNSRVEETLLCSIKDNKGESYQEFVISPDSIVQFFLLPEKGQSYYAEIRNTKGEKYKTSPLEVQESGLSVKVNALQSNKIKFSLEANHQEWLNKTYNIIVHSFAKMNKAFQVQLKKTAMSFDLTAEELNPGVNVITVFSEAGLPVTERMFFVSSPKTRERIGTATIESTISSNQIKVSIDIQNTTKEDAVFSLSALPSSYQAFDKKTNLTSYFMLDSYLNPNIYHTIGLLKNSNYVNLKKIDDLLIATGNRKFNWEGVVQLSKQKFIHEFERGFNFAGNLIDFNYKKDFGKGSAILISQENGLLLNAPLDSLGRFNFENLYLIDSTYINISAEVHRGRNWNRKVKITGRNIKSDTTLINFKMLRTMSSSSTLQSIVDYKMKGIVLEDVTVTKNKSELLKSKIFHKGINDDSFLVDENSVKKYSTLIELLRSKFMINVMDYGSDKIEISMRGGMMGLGADGSIKSNNPVLVLDGMVINDLNYLRDLDIYDIEEVAVNKTGMNLLGPIGANGAIFIQTRTTPLQYNQLNDMGKSNNFFQSLIAKGYTPPETFLSSDYIKQAPVEMLNQLGSLYWESNIQTVKGKSVVSFTLPWACDEMTIFLEGMSKDGVLFSEERKIKIN